MPGTTEEALGAGADWLLRAVAGNPVPNQIMYGPAASDGWTEWEVPWLPGYEGSAAGSYRQRRAWTVPARRLRRSHVGAVIESVARPDCRLDDGRLGLSRSS